MAKKKKERSEVWWLARGSSSHSRQPSFAPPTARPSVSISSFGFGWHRQKSCFVTSESHDILSPPRMKEYPCDVDVARSMLRCCAYKKVAKRFFENRRAQEDDFRVYVAAGFMFSISLTKSRRDFSGGLVPAEASLHFYSPDNKVQGIYFRNGMTGSFAGVIKGMKASEIAAMMQ